ncbi:FtsW/RodA/SpoVE family cell cycle protein [Thalassoglobus polymorphus]|uniref:Cell wall polymerase n=1 Tax=Thalassoglobus polymorphus TaxID=2527994 RepID=A0A517QJG3_9PLAN|nr:FtsW/RodA/SpoVE family cell cycle protein [Thalassoglobus polymorphus]QDT31766.1 Peptidoglycan glycosyltransferase MrdB [Thalassoglobus polymorphus]
MHHGRSIPWTLVAVPIITLLLLLLGISGIGRGDELASAGVYAPRQVMWLFFAAAAMVVSLVVPFRQLKEWAYPALICSIVMLIAVYFFPPRNGARRWIPLGFMYLQPSELAKVAYILAISRYLMFRENHRTVAGLVVPFLMTCVPVILILREPDLGTSLLLFPVLFAVLFAAGARFRHLATTIIAGVLILPMLWSVMSVEQKSRVTALFRQRDSGSPQTGDGYHLWQSKQMLALGGKWGSSVDGMPLDDPAAYRLPAGRTDFVYCLIGEKWGLPGTLGVLALFAAFCLCGLHIAAKTRDPFGRLVATGIVAMIGTQALFNMAMTVGLAPITGLTLPLLSYGGSSLVTTCLSIGLLANIALRPGYDLAGQPFQFDGK